MSRIRANQITNQAADGAPTVQNGLVVSGVTTSTTFSGSGASLTNIPDSALSSVTASKLTGALPAISGANLTNLDASDLTSGTVPTARLGSGTASSSTFLRGDSTFAAVTSTTINSNADNRVITGSGTANTLNGESNLTFTGSLLTVTGNISLPDSSAPDYIGNIYIGNSNDFKLFHNGYDNFIRSGAGNHNIRIDNNSGVLGARFIPAGAAELYHNGTKMCETSTNGLAFPAGKGIDFSADGSGTLKSLPNSFNAEVLHDYENGTFTPNIQYDTGTNQYYGSPGSGHYVSTSKGEYIRIGDMVWAAGQITLTGNRNSTQTVHISIGGMPYNGLHSSQQSSLMSGWGGAAWPKNDSNSSFRLYYSYHSYTTLNFAFKQTAGNNGIDGFRFHVYYRCAP